MISCDSMTNLLSEYIDSELADAIKDDVEMHLDGCEACRIQLEELQQLNVQLNRVLGLPNIDNQILQAAKLSRPTPDVTVDSQATQTARASGSIGRSVAMLAVAATLLLGLFFAIDKFRLDALPKNPIVARLIGATGPVEILAVGNEEWLTIAADDSREIPLGARLRTSAKALCEIRTNNNGKVRLADASEIIVSDSQQLQLVSGKIWCNAPDDQPLEIRVPLQDSKPIELAMFRCPSNSSFQCESQTSFASCSSPSDSAASELAEVQVGTKTWQIEPGKTAVVDGSRNVAQRPWDATADVWQLPLLALSNDSNAELRATLVNILASIGRTKASLMSEQQIRKLGPAGAVPLLAFVVDEAEGENQRLRRTAMRLAIETADESAISLVQRLTEDDDIVIARQAQSLLDRLAVR